LGPGLQMLASIFEHQSTNLRPRTEVQDKSQLERSGPQVVQQLRFVGGNNPFRSFQFKQEYAVYN